MGEEEVMMSDLGERRRGQERTVKNIVIKINLNGSFSDVHA